VELIRQFGFVFKVFVLCGLFGFCRFRGLDNGFQLSRNSGDLWEPQKANKSPRDDKQESQRQETKVTVRAKCGVMFFGFAWDGTTTYKE
jgi:hypothetical protein